MVTTLRIRHILLGTLLALIAALISERPVAAEPVGLMEEFVLAEDRLAMLDRLIPGSDDYYFYYCLHYQTSGQLERAETILRDWVAEKKGRETPLISSMIDRQRLLAYRDSPQRTIDHLIRRLGVKLNHTPPIREGQRRYPSQLDNSLLAVDRLVKDALRRNDQLKPAGLQYLAELFRSGNTADVTIDLRDFLQRIEGPYIDHLDELVIKELNARRPTDRKFGDLKAHAHLTLAELQRVAQRVPSVADDNTLVNAVLQRMRPDADSDPSQQPQIRWAYLRDLEAYLRTLPAAYNSLKASATFRLLEANLAVGEYDRELFLRYLQLPRVSPIVHRDWQPRASVKANPADNFMQQALLPPIANEQPLVRSYLEHFLKDAENTAEFDEYLQPDYLRRVFAETKLLYGIGSEDRWYRLLDAKARGEIRDSVELRLAAENPTRFADETPTELIVDLKNVSELVIRLYEINTSSYYRAHDRDIDTDIDLDGLVPTYERSIKYNQPPVRRHRERLSLDQISGRGVWIADLVGGGVRARALIRRGDLHHVDSTSADGMVFTILDENRKPVPTATMLVGSQEFVADDDGRIVLPPVTASVTRRAIISDGKISKSILFPHLQEQYVLQAGMHLDRTQLQSGSAAELLIRPRLLMGSTPIDPKTLSDVSVQIEASDLDGLSINNRIDKLELDQNSELVVSFRVPPRLASLTATLSGKVDGLADARQQTLQTSHRWEVAGIRRTSHTRDAFLTRDGDEYVIEVRGRNGELSSGASVTLSLTTRARNSAVDQTLQCNDDGQVRLGPLEGVTQVRFGIPGALQHVRGLKLNQVRWPNVVHAAATADIRLPLADAIGPVTERYRLFEMREKSYRRDASEELSEVDGLLVISPLAAGNYRLVDRNNGAITSLAVVEGPVIENVAVGQVRHRSVNPAKSVGIASIDRNADGLRVQLSGSHDTARVHIYVSRYFDSVMPLDGLALPSLRRFGRSVSLGRCGYVSDLRLGEEYQYVLRRRYAKKYPGVMLPQPGVILNPWETEETSNSSDMAREGTAPPPTAAQPRSDLAAEADSTRQQRAQTVESDYDFLSDAGVVVANLRADRDGVVKIPADVIDGLPLIQVVVSDAVNLLQRTVSAPLGSIETTDLRLTKSLDVDKPLSFERGVTVASPDGPLDLASLGSAQLQVYESVASLLKLYKTLVDDPRLADFDELGRWHLLDRESKLSAYSRLACHELHLFLWAHDRDFFEQIVQPYLENKKEKQFVDRWLLNLDLSDYQILWRYNQLNAAERVLLAMRLPEARSVVLRQIREELAIREDDFDELRRGIDSALMGRGMMMGEEYLEEAEAMDSMGFGGVGGGFGAMSGTAAPNAVRELLERQKSVRNLRRKAGQIEFDVDSRNAAGMLFRGRGATAANDKFFFRDLDSTKQWAESQWDRVRTVGGPDPGSLIAANAFWLDLAGADAGDLSVSANLLRPLDNRHSVLIALALCGLPLQPGDVGLPTDGEQEYRPAHAVAVVTKRLKTLMLAEMESSILIGQRFETLESKDRPSRSRDLPAEPDEFVTGQAYRGQLVVSNPTAERKLVDLFWQLPAGSLPLAGSQITDSRTLVIEPFAVEAIEYPFYFPESGQFRHYPATVSSDGTLLARGNAKTFNVVDQPSEPTGLNWEKVARDGTPDQLREFLQTANLRDLDWMLIAHRMDDPSVYRVIIRTLQESKLPITELWAYSLKHRDEPAIGEFLAMRQDLVDRVGPALDSPLLKVEPIDRRQHELLEYSPLVRARIHPLREEPEILNPTFLGQYRSFLRMLGFLGEIPPSERIVLTYYLLLQNRIEEAIDEFAKIDRGALETQLQYDYVAAYLAMHQQQLDQAQRLVAGYKEHPIPRWQSRFTQLASQLDQRRRLNQNEQLVSVDQGQESNPVIEEGSGDLAVLDRERRQQSASAEQPEVIVRVEGDTLRIDHQNADQVTLNFYGVDLELLFSKAPFVREDLQRMAMVRPTRREQVDFGQAHGVGRYQLDENLQRQTLLVEVVAGASRSTALYYGGEVTTYVSESFGQLQTTDSISRRPVATAYVKVYAKYPDGSVKFYKDGYTDLRGRFDYASISADDAKGASRFAILVISDEKGATLHDVAAPTR